MHREMLLEQLSPVEPLEEILAARIVDLSWRLKRAVQDQNEAFVALYDRQTAGAQEPQEPAERAGMIGRMILEDFSQEAVLERLLRYERRIESSLYRTLNELRRVHDQVQKAALEDANTLERWREEDWNAKKARAFARCPPPEVSPGPAGGTTNTPRAEVPHPCAIPSWQDASPAPDGPPEDETCKTNPIGEEVSSLKCQVSSESCKTNPILVTPRGTGIPSASLSGQALPVNANHGQDAHATIPPDGVTTNLAQAQGQLCETNPIAEGVASLKCEVSGLKLEEPASSPRSLPASDFTLQTSGGTPAAQSQSCKTNPICGGGSGRPGGYTPIFRRRR